MLDGVIIGGGVAAPSIVRGIIGDKIARGDQRKLCITIVEPRAWVGIGTAWDEEPGDAMMLSNMHRDRLMIYGTGKHPGALEFETPRDLMPSTGRLPGAQPYAARAEVGDHLRHYFEETTAIAYGAGIMLQHVRARAIGICKRRRGFAIELSNGELLKARCVVLALGLLAVDNHTGLAGHPGYHADSWNRYDLLESIEPGSRVAILGCGPTAIDWALRLGRLNLRHPVHMVSRSGRLPAVRPAVAAPIKDSHYSRIKLRARAAKWGPMSPRAVDDVITGVMAEAGAKPADLVHLDALARPGRRLLMEATLRMSEKVQPFFEGLKLLDDLSTTIWRCSSPEARDHIMSRWAKRQATYSFAIPPPNARAILAGVGAGRIVTMGGLTEASANAGGFCLRLQGKSGNLTEVEADIVINATGFEGSLDQCTNPFVRSLVKDGLLQMAGYGGAELLYETGEVLGPNGLPIPGLFAAGGSICRSSAYLVNSIVDTSEHGVLVGMECARYLFREAQQGEDASAIESKAGSTKRQPAST
jgi:uncharacterized NAD(P)/FAD-binding protein YdhS